MKISKDRVAPKFAKTKPDFATVLRKRVNAHFAEKKLSTNADFKMVMKTIFYLAAWLGSYAILITQDLTFWQMFATWCVWGFSFAACAVNIGHDAIHGSYSKNKVVTYLLKQTFNLNGASAYMWGLMHNVAHHTYTNIEEHDEDIYSTPILRMTSDIELKPIHRFQHIYCFFLYPFASLSWIFSKDYKKFFENTVANYNNKQHPKSELFNLFFYKILSYTIFIVIPFIVIDLPFGQKLISFLCAHFIAGFYVAVVFMLAHIVEEVSFPKPDKLTGTVENNWFIHQLYTTANFATDSKLAAFITGGLNQQVEHHLFPNICSTHYPAIAQIVRDTAKEFEVPYLESKTYFGAVKSHIRFLKNMGKQPEVA